MALSNPPQDINSPAFQSWIYQAWKAILNGGGGGGTVTSVSGTAPITVTNPTANAVLTVPTFVASGSGHASGLVPDPGSSAGTTHFLREDATWALPSAPPAGSVLQLKTHIDTVGGTTTSTSYVSITTTAFAFTPLSTNSTIVVDAQLSFEIDSSSSSVVPNFTIQLFDGATALGNAINTQLGVSASPSGITQGFPGFIRTFISNSSLTARSIGLQGRVGGASMIGHATQVYYTITEIQN